MQRLRNFCNFSVLLLLVVVIVDWMAQAAPTDTPVFGTEAGYDAGGNEPICFLSNFLAVSNTAGGSSIEELNQQLYEQDVSATLLSECFPGTSLEVIPLDLSDRRLQTGVNYTFRLKLSSNLTAINENIFIKALQGKSTIFARLHLCDAIKTGFCNPLTDTREIDESVRPSETDLAPRPEDKFPNNETRWKYAEGDTLLGIQDEVLVFSRWIQWTLREIEPGSEMYKTQVDITFQIPTGSVRTGAYFFIGQAVMNFDIGGGNLTRVDVADAVPDNVVEVFDPPDIMTVSQGMKIGLGIAIGIFGSAALFLFSAVVYYRKHAVMKLAQAPFLATMAGAGLVQIVFTYTYLPTKDIHCRLSGPLVLTPMTLVGAILVGRMWRVYVALSSVNTLGRAKKQRFDFGELFVQSLTFLISIPLLCTCEQSTAFRRRTSLRRMVTAKECWCLIFMLALPQVVLQTLLAVFNETGLELQLDDQRDDGRIVCEDDTRRAMGVGTILVLIVYVSAVILAWISRNLPSAFNEKDQIFQAATISSIIAFIDIVLLEIIDEPGTAPDVKVFLESVFSIGVAASVQLLIIWPKVRRVWSGEEVVVTNMLGAQYGAERFSNQTAGSSGTASLPQSPKPEHRIVLHEHSPVPSSIEGEMLRLQGLLQNLSRQMGDGRPLSRDDWDRLRNEIVAFHEELDLLNFEWNHAQEVIPAKGEKETEANGETPQSDSSKCSA